MKPETFIFAGGIFNMAFAVFHVFFWKLFHWKTDLAKLTALNRAVVQVLNLSLIFVFLIFAYLSFAHTQELLSTDIGRAILILAAMLWYLRALEQIVFFGLRRPLSVLFLALFVGGGSLYLAPFF